jgi:hypothetical protein
MRNQKLIDIIIKDADEILTLVNNFSKYTETKIPQIYVDLTLSKVKNLYTELQLINKQNEDFDNIKSLEELLPGMIADKAQADLVSKPGEEDIEVVEGLENIDVKENEVNGTVEHKIESLSEKEDILKKREEHILSTQLKFDKIENLKSSIDINKKIWFIKELFNGDIDIYNTTLDIIQNFSFLEEALDYIDDNFNWDFMNKTVKDFMEFVYRKFI